MIRHNPQQRVERWKDVVRQLYQSDLCKEVTQDELDRRRDNLRREMRVEGRGFFHNQDLGRIAGEMKSERAEWLIRQRQLRQYGVDMLGWSEQEVKDYMDLVAGFGTSRRSDP